jgi:iron complex outermembrane recepter protein
MIRTLSFVAVATSLAAAPHTAAQNPQTPIRLPTVTVTATREGESLTVPGVEEARDELSETPGGTALVDAEEYLRGRATTLKDALDFAPGVYIQPRFGAEEARISIRGSGLQRTFHGRGLKLMQDDVPLNLADGGFDFQAIEPLSTRYIEVYRGANALEFGATTLGGAVNFVSFTGYDASPLQARFEFGSFESFRGQLSSGEVIGPFDYYISLTHFSQDGFREHSQQNTQRLFANFGYRFSPELETRFYVTYVQTDSELPGAIAKAQLEDDPTEPQRNPFFAPLDVVLSNWKRDFELFRIANKTTWHSGDHRVSLGTFWSWKDLDHPILFWIDQLSNDFGVNLRYDNTADLFGRKNRLTLGIAPAWGVIQDNRFANRLGNRGKRLEPSPFGTSAPADNEQTALNLEFYAQDRFYFLPQWALVVGAQVSYAKRENDDEFPVSPANSDHSDEQDWWGFSPKIGLLWEITSNAQAFVNVSRSFEPPSFGELVNAAEGGLVTLDAQTATTIEVGTRGRAGRFAWDIVYYHAWLDDELLQFEILPGLTQTVNAGGTIHQGVEAALDVDLLTGIFTRDARAATLSASDGKKAVTPPASEPAGDRLVLRQLYLWNDFHFDDDPVFGNNQLAGIPEHYYRAELLYEHPCGFYAGPNVEWVPLKWNVDFAETLFADSYAILGFKIGWRSERGFSVFFEAKNLTDKKYAATTNVIANAAGLDSQQFFPGDSRGFFGGVEWKW